MKLGLISCPFSFTFLTDEIAERKGDSCTNRYWSTGNTPEKSRKRKAG